MGTFQERVFEELRVIRELMDQQRAKPMPVDEAAAYLGIKKPTLYKKMSAKEIAYSKPGKIALFDRADLDRYIAANRIRSREELDRHATAL